MVVKITLLASTITGVFLYHAIGYSYIIVLIKKWFRGRFYFWKPPQNISCLIITRCKQFVKCQLRKNVKPVTFFFIQAYYIVIDGWNSGIFSEQILESIVIASMLKQTQGEKQSSSKSLKVA